jgi:hypothetical protein
VVTAPLLSSSLQLLVRSGPSELFQLTYCGRRRQNPWVAASGADAHALLEQARPAAATPHAPAHPSLSPCAAAPPHSSSASPGLMRPAAAGSSGRASTCGRPRRRAASSGRASPSRACEGALTAAHGACRERWRRRLFWACASWHAVAAGGAAAARWPSPVSLGRHPGASGHAVRDSKQGPPSHLILQLQITSEISVSCAQQRVCSSYSRPPF